jgi:hypothetical protein
MAQPRTRTQRDRATKAWKPDPRRSHRLDPIFDEILTEDAIEDIPGVFGALRAIEDMRDWGVDVTPEIARECMQTHRQRALGQEEFQEQMELRLQARRHPPIVYYMRLGNLVKIGFTANLTNRMGSIRPQELMVTEPGGREREQERHAQFADLKAHGEWFRLESPLTEHIEAVRREAAGD